MFFACSHAHYIIMDIMFTGIFGSFQLVGGKFDLESNFVVKDFSNVRHVIKFIAHVSVKLQVS